MARISLSQMFNSGLRGILNVQAQTLKTQNQIATGKRVLTPADDPVAAARILQIEQEQAGITQYQKNIDGVENSLMLEESQLEAVTNLLVRVRELSVRAGAGSMSTTERQTIAAELSTRLDELTSLANTRNSSGEYIFGGFKGQQPPFVRNADGTFTYRGDDGQRLVQISDSTRVATGDSGREIFENIPIAAVPSAAGLTVNVAVGVANTGAAVIDPGTTITDPLQFGATFGPGTSFEVRITAAPVDPALDYAYEIFDNAGVTTGVTGTYVPGDPANAIAFGGAEFQSSGAPAVGDTITLSAAPVTGGAISAALIVDRNAYRDTFHAGQPPFSLTLTGFDEATQIYTYAVTDSSAPPVVIEPAGSFSATDPATTTGNAGGRPGTPITFGGVEFYLVDGEVGDSFTLDRPPVETRSMLDTIALLTSGLSTLDDTPAGNQQLKDLIATTLASLDNAESQVGKVRSQVGARLNTLDSTRDLHGGIVLVNDKVLSEIRDLDYAEAITRLTKENFVLQAAQQSFAKISGMSLFNFLR